MIAIDRALLTDRLRLEPVTAAICEHANAGPEYLAKKLDADIPPDWIRAGLPLVRHRQPALRPWRPIRAVVIHQGDCRVIGDIRFERTSEPEEVIYEIGYAIIQDYRRQGFAVEAAGRVIDWLFDRGCADLVIAGCDRKNRPSVRTLRKLGFWLDGSRGAAFWWRLTPELREERLARDARA
ncbi:MAG: GNAT family N-acetyltransferase [Hyphomonadaceae bacterium]